MQLYITPGSPYARIVRIVILEKRLEDRVRIIAAKTRTEGSPYYAINPSGRVPHLVRDDGVGMEDSALISAYLDHLDGKPAFDPPPGEAGWEARRLEALARSLMDGVLVSIRQFLRPQDERSPWMIRHEADRARRVANLWEAEIGHPLMQGPLNMAQIVLACTLDLEQRQPDFRWRDGHPQLCAWFARAAARPSFIATAPPGAARSNAAMP